MLNAAARPASVQRRYHLCRLDSISIDGTPDDHHITHTNGTARNRSYIKLAPTAGITLQHTLLSSISIDGHESYAPHRAPNCSGSQTSRTLLEIVCSEIGSNMQLTPPAPNATGDTGAAEDRRNVLIISRHRSGNLPQLKEYAAQPPDSAGGDAADRSPNLRTSATASTLSASEPPGASLLSLPAVVDRLHSGAFATVLRGLQDLLCLAPQLNASAHERELVTIYRQLLVCCRSPRIVLVRATCHVSGVLFRIVRCTRRPEFDELVQALLQRTADTNRFLQADANEALDRMVAAVAPAHSVRALSAYGLPYRSAVVRCSVARLLCSVCRLHGNEALLGATANEPTRKRLLGALARLLVDKSQECRRAAEELCGLMQTHRLFAEYFYKDLESRKRVTLMRAIRQMNRK